MPCENSFLFQYSKEGAFPAEALRMEDDWLIAYIDLLLNLMEKPSLFLFLDPI